MDLSMIALRSRHFESWMFFVFISMLTIPFCS